VGEFDQFLDSHPAIAREPDRNPSLVSDKEYLTIRPELQQYLQSHPTIDQELAAHPDAFMSAEERYDRSGDQARLYGRRSVGIRSGDNDTASTELKSFAGFLSDHPELQSYLKTNPGVAEELRENPQTFMTPLGQSSTSSGMSRKGSASEQTRQKLTPNPSPQGSGSPGRRRRLRSPSKPGLGEFLEGIRHSQGERRILTMSRNNPTSPLLLFTLALGITRLSPSVSQAHKKERFGWRPESWWRCRTPPAEHAKKASRHWETFLPASVSRT
jgi:hypothetical protein